MLAAWMLLRVPADAPDLAAAVERAQDGDEIRIEGVVAGGVTIGKRVTLSGGARGDAPETWGVVRGGGPRALILTGPVVVRNLRVENPVGHGIRIEAGTPMVSEVRLDVAETAFGIVGDAAPVLDRCEVARCNNGILVLGTARPHVSDLRVTAAGGGIVVRERGAGRFVRHLLVTGRFAAVEVADDAAPDLSAIEIYAATGAVFVRDRGRPTLTTITVHRCGLAGLEVTGQANPDVRGLTIVDCGGAGLHLHGDARGTYVDIVIRAAVLAGLDLAERAVVALEQVTVTQSAGAGVYLHDEASAEVDFLTVGGTGGPCIDAQGRATVRVDDGALTHGLGVAVRAGADAVVTLCRVGFVGTGGALVRNGGGRVEVG